jgi:hypothetical protein
MKRQHLSAAHSGIHGGYDRRPQQGRSNGEQLGLLVFGNAPLPLVVFSLQSDEDLCAAAKRCSLDVLAADSPIQQVTKERDRPVDRRRGEYLAFVLADGAWLFQLRDEVLDISRSDGREGTPPEVFDQWLEAVVGRAGELQANSRS